MQEDYQSKSLSELREIARERGFHGISATRKGLLIEQLIEDDRKREAAEEKKTAAPAERQEPPARTPRTAEPSGEAAERPQGMRHSVYHRQVRDGQMSAGTHERREVHTGERHYAPDGRKRVQAYGRPEGGPSSETPRTYSGQRPYADASRGGQTARRTRNEEVFDISSLDSGQTVEGILEVIPEGFGFIRSANYMPGDNDVYVSPSQIRRFNLKTGDVIRGSIRVKTGQEKFAALLYVNSVNDEDPSVAEHRPAFEDLTPIFPEERLNLEVPGGKLAMRVIDLLAPIGKGQRGMIVSPPKAGKTTLLKQIARGITTNHPDMSLLILLIDERPEEVTDIKETVEGENVEVIYSTFDEMPEHHKKVSEMVLERAKRLVEHGRDVIILLDSLTRLTRAYNLTVTPSGRTLSGGLDPASLYMPKKFFGAARNVRGGGSLTIVATALVDTGSRMDDIVFEEFRGTGNMEVVLDRKLSERRIFPAIELSKSSTRRDDLLLTQEEFEAVFILRKALNGLKPEEAAEKILEMFARTRSNEEVVMMAKKIRL